MSEKIIEVSGLQKSYKENHVLKDVSFTIDKGSIFALLGSNGAGKTTVIKILSTLLKADGGSAVVNGFNVATNGGNVRECISVAVRSVSGFRNDIIKQRLNITHESGNIFLLDFFILIFLLFFHQSVLKIHLLMRAGFVLYCRQKFHFHLRALSLNRL